MKQDKAADLLKVLGQKTPTATPAETTTEPTPAKAAATAKRAKAAPAPKQATRPATTHAKPLATRGRGVHLWFHEEDEKLIRELSVWLHGHRPRINDSLVIKAVLRAAKTDAALLAAYDEAVKIDGRLREAKKRQSV